MKRATVLVALLTLVVMAAASQKHVVKPRTKPGDYPVVREQEKFTLGAAQLSPKQVRKAFVSNLRKDYVVVEIGVFPKTETQISPQDFVLVAKNHSEEIAPMDPEKMAYKINDKDQSGHDIAVYPTTSIEYSTGRDPNDPYYPDGRGRGVHVENGVMVAVGDNKKSPKASAGDLKAMTAELKEKGLPEGTTSHPVAGYIYFPVSGQAGPYQLKYHGPSGPVVFDLPMPPQ